VALQLRGSLVCGALLIVLVDSFIRRDGLRHRQWKRYCGAAETPSKSNLSTLKRTTT